MHPTPSRRRPSPHAGLVARRPDGARFASEQREHERLDERRVVQQTALEKRQPDVQQPILVVEDDAAVQTMLLMALEDAEYPVEVAMNGAEALEQLDRVDPRLILLDLRMPIMDGATFLRTLYAQEGRRIPPIIVMTAYRDIDPTAAALGLPSISKPMDMALLMRMIAQYMAPT